MASGKDNAPVYDTIEDYLKGEMQDQINCYLCKKPTENPRVLTCLHSFCTKCLEPVVDKVPPCSPPSLKKIIKCPQCGVKTEIPSGNVQELQSNFFIQHIVDLMEYFSSRDAIPVVFCGHCRRTSNSGVLERALVRCPNCALFLCKACYELHSMDDLTRHHKTFSITHTDVDHDSLPQLSPASTSSDKCSLHGNRKNLLFCLNCNKGICSQCAKGTHGDHDVAFVDELVAIRQPKLERLSEEVKKLLPMLDSCLEQVQQLGVAVEKSGQNQLDEVERRHEVLQQVIEERKDSLCEYADRCQAGIDLNQPISVTQDRTG